MTPSKSEKTEQSQDPKDDPSRPRAAGVSSAGPGPRGRASVVMDASAVLVLLFAEPGADDVAEHVAQGAAISTVNLAEVATVLVRRGLHPEQVLGPVCQQLALEQFTVEDALSVAALHPVTGGLSLGDRACLALAKRLSVAALTADRPWTRLDLDVVIRLVKRQT